MPAGKTIVGAGEILWDVYPDGPRFGGAPANFAGTSAALASNDDQIFIVSAVGSDPLGNDALEALAGNHVQTKAVQQNKSETGNVQVTLNSAGVATYEFATNSAWDHLVWNDQLADLAHACDAVCFGTLGQRSPASRAVLQKFVAATSISALRVLDINLRDPFWDADCILQSLELANVLKMNEDELPVIADMISQSGTPEQQLEEIAQRYSLSTVALTKGPEGATVWQNGHIHNQPAMATEVVSTVGAGDAFTAALVRGLLDQISIQDTVRSAIKTASDVCASPDSILNRA
ncbi:MAG: carbohydrate kinase [Fuerstiella sp.]